MKVKCAIPNKGRLLDPTLELLEESGIGAVDRGTRQLFARTNDPELDLVFIRTQDIPNIVGRGTTDLGVTGHDIVLESDSEVEELLDLEFGKAKMIVAKPENSSIQSIEDVPKGSKVATEFPRITQRYFEERDIDIELTAVSGATEITPLLGVADLIVDLTSTGTTLRTHKLKVLDTLFETSARLIVNPESFEEKKEKINDIKIALESVTEARLRKLVLMNVPKDKLPAIKKIMPGMAGPTVSKVEGTDMLAVQAVVKADKVYETVRKAQNKGARDILVVPIERALQ